jgi:16S rRNA (cytidine1402-2'-O)-methyltransferase
MAKLILISTPLGNLGDLTQRAAEALRTLKWIACEDTRVTSKLVAHVGGGGKLISVREANERAEARRVIEHLAGGDDVGYCTDAGAPGVSDPGAELVRAVVEAGYIVEALPGPSAVATAAAVSGLVSDRFYFAGFVPSKRNDRLAALRALPAGVPIIVYEAPHRAGEFLTDAAEILGDRACVVCRELSKKHEEILRTTIGEAAKREEWRGELTIVIAAGEATTESAGDFEEWLAKELARPGARLTDLARAAASLFGLSRSEAYSRILEARRSESSGE